MKSREADLDRFYALLTRLQDRCCGLRTLGTCEGSMGWPTRGVYFFFEDGEMRSDGLTPRVVRVGTHALRQSSSTIWRRLSQHRGQQGGAFPGGGNHRGSTFRLHVGTALQARDGLWPEAAATWGRGATPPPGAREVEHRLERAVSAHIRVMPFLWVGVDDEPSAASERGVIEAGAIGLLSNYDVAGPDAPSPGWLGRFADREAVRRSGLWNVNHVRGEHDPRFLDVFERWVDRTPENSSA